MVRRALEPGWHELEVSLDFRSLIEQQIARHRSAALHGGGCDSHPCGREGVRTGGGADRESSRLADLEVHQAIATATQNPQLADLDCASATT